MLGAGLAVSGLVRAIERDAENLADVAGGNLEGLGRPVAGDRVARRHARDIDDTGDRAIDVDESLVDLGGIVAGRRFAVGEKRAREAGDDDLARIEEGLRCVGVRLGVLGRRGLGRDFGVLDALAVLAVLALDRLLDSLGAFIAFGTLGECRRCETGPGQSDAERQGTQQAAPACRLEVQQPIHRLLQADPVIHLIRARPPTATKLGYVHQPGLGQKPRASKPSRSLSRLRIAGITYFALANVTAAS